MDTPAPADISLSEGFRLDRRAGVLFRRDQQGVFTPIAIGRRALDLLAVLVERPGDLIPRDEIIDAVWPGTTVEDSNLNVQIAALRRLLDDGRAEGSCIQTVSGRGYRFTAEVRRLPAQNPSVASARGNATGSPVAEISHSAPVVPERGLSGGLPATTVSDGEQGKNRIPDPAALFTIDAGVRRRRLRFAPRVTASSRRLAAIPGPAIAAVIVLTLVLGLGAWWLWPSTKSSSAPAVATAMSIPQPLAAPRLSIVVMPFANLSDDPDQQYFADGITEDLTTDLSRLAHSFVISRNTAFTYRNKPIETKQIGRDLGVRYVLEGSVRRSGNRVRVNAQLIDAETDAHLWAERFDGDAGDLFALGNEITSRIAVELSLDLLAAEGARPTENPDALDYILRGRAALSKPQARENYAEVIDLYERALALDPHSVEAQSRLASVLAGRVMDYMPGSSDSDLKRAEELVSQALAASPRNPFAHFAKGQLLRAQGRHTEAIPEYETARASDHNWVVALAHIARCKTFVGPIEEAIPLLEQAIRLSPRDPNIAMWYDRIGQVHLLQSRIEEAILWFERARSVNSKLPFFHLHLASAYALNGETEPAGVELAEARKLQGEGSYSSIVRFRLVSQFRGARPEIRALFEATYLAGLRKAGVPEE